jgi:type IV secretory pathway TrbD component
MATEDHLPPRHTVYRAINKPLLFAGVDRRYFFFAVVFGAAVFTLFSSLIGGIGIFAALYMFAHWATKTDPQILPILFKPLMNPGKVKVLYDPGKIVISNLILSRDK